MSGPTRWVVVDDTHPSVRYAGPWFSSVGAYTDSGRNGAPYNSTLHGASDFATLSFDFEGTAIRVIGSALLRASPTNATSPFSCFVDGIKAENYLDYAAQSHFEDFENGLKICSMANLEDVHHTLTVTVTGADSEIFWLDSIQYAPSKGVDYEQGALLLASEDTELLRGLQSPRVDTPWVKPPTTNFSMQATGASFQCDFYGSSIRWYQMGPAQPYNGSYDFPTTSAIYSVDDHPARKFSVPSYGSTTHSLYNRMLFETPHYSKGKHRLTVVYQGTSGQGSTFGMPLELDYLLIQNGTLSQVPSSRSGPNVPLIAGASAAGFAILLIIFAIALYIYRRRGQLQHGVKRRAMTDVEPYSHVQPDSSRYTYVPLPPTRPQSEKTITVPLTGARITSLRVHPALKSTPGNHRIQSGSTSPARHLQPEPPGPAPAEEDVESQHIYANSRPPPAYSERPRSF